MFPEDQGPVYSPSMQASRAIASLGISVCDEIGFGNQLRLNHSSESFCCTPCFFDHFRVKYETSLFTLRFRLDSKKIALIYSFFPTKWRKLLFVVLD